MSTNQHDLAYLDLMGIEVYKPRGYGSIAEVVLEDSAATSDTASDEVHLSQEHVVSEPTPAVAEVHAEATAPIPSTSVTEQSALSWESLSKEIAECTRCALCETRTQTVFGVGNPQTDILFIGEAPGAEEDRRGEPFVGRAGQLLDEMLLSIGLDRTKTFIANILKCRPPNNRDPKANEVEQCFGYLEKQIEFIDPKVIVVLGRVAAQNLLKSELNMGQIRRQPHFFGDKQIPVVATYHPAYLLRSPSQKKASWQDFVRVKQLIQLT